MKYFFVVPIYIDRHIRMLALLCGSLWILSGPNKTGGSAWHFVEHVNYMRTRIYFFLTPGGSKCVFSLKRFW
ncbi:hypothetical protein ACJX0J_035272, partial [Zea mays]